MMPLFLCGAASALFLLRSTLQTPPPLLQSAHPVSRPLMLCGSVVKAVTFAETGLCRSMLRAAQQQQWLTPTSVQSEAIPAILSGSDVWAQAPTGSGKTAAFALPLLQRLDTGAPRPRGRHVNTLILSPTRELAVQTSEAFRALSDSAGTRAKIVALHGGVSINPQLRSLAGGADVLVATPGRLLDVLANNGVQLERVATLVLDEADRLLANEFSFELERVLEALPPPASRQTLVFSATFPFTSRPKAKRLLRPSHVRVSSELAQAAADLEVTGSEAGALEAQPKEEGDHDDYDDDDDDEEEEEEAEVDGRLGVAQRRRPIPSGSERYSSAPPPATIEQRAILVDRRERTPLLRHLLDSQGWARCLVFVGSQKAADHVASKLKNSGSADGR
jgi:superfamily II DNA/RNA helicase